MAFISFVGRVLFASVESHQFHPAIAPLIFQFFVAPLQGNSPDQTIIDANLEKLGKVLDLTYMKLS
uniref:Uncharacterized protein n=1 Tax=Salix viminalis TaxID=40686 RepID=A0A6N2LLC6_SALVM